MKFSAYGRFCSEDAWNDRAGDFSAFGPGAASGVAQDDKRPRIDVGSYTIDAQINPDAQTLTARVAVRFVPDEQTSAVTFELNNALNVSRIVDDKGQTLQSSRNPQDNTVRVTFAEHGAEGSARYADVQL